MPSSVSVGVRPSDFRIFWYSSSVMPCSRISSGVMVALNACVDIVGNYIFSRPTQYLVIQRESRIAEAGSLVLLLQWLIGTMTQSLNPPTLRETICFMSDVIKIKLPDGSEKE